MQFFFSFFFRIDSKDFCDLRCSMSTSNSFHCFVNCCLYLKIFLSFLIRSVFSFRLFRLPNDRELWIFLWKTECPVIVSFEWLDKINKIQPHLCRKKISVLGSSRKCLAIFANSQKFEITRGREIKKKKNELIHWIRSMTLDFSYKNEFRVRQEIV